MPCVNSSNIYMPYMLSIIFLCDLPALPLLMLRWGLGVYHLQAAISLQSQSLLGFGTSMLPSSRLVAQQPQLTRLQGQSRVKPARWRRLVSLLCVHSLLTNVLMFITKTLAKTVEHCHNNSCSDHSTSSWTSLFISNVHSDIFDDLYDFIM